MNKKWNEIIIESWLGYGKRKWTVEKKVFSFSERNEQILMLFLV